MGKGQKCKNPKYFAVNRLKNEVARAFAVDFEKFQCTRQIHIDILVHPWKFPVGPGSGFLSGFRFLYFWWSYRKKFYVGKFLLSYWFFCTYNFPGGPGSGFLSGFWFLYFLWLYQNISFNILIHLLIKFSGWSGVRFSVRFPVFVLLIVVSKYFLYRKISFVLLNSFYARS